MCIINLLDIKKSAISIPIEIAIIKIISTNSCVLYATCIKYTILLKPTTALKCRYYFFPSFYQRQRWTSEYLNNISRIIHLVRSQKHTQTYICIRQLTIRKIETIQRISNRKYLTPEIGHAGFWKWKMQKLECILTQRLETVRSSYQLVDWENTNCYCQNLAAQRKGPHLCLAKPLPNVSLNAQYFFLLITLEG